MSHNFINIKINKHIFHTKIVKNKKDVIKGMMGSKFDGAFKAMLFISPFAHPNQPHYFWMKNCIIPLDIIFIQNGKISGIQHNCPPCHLANSVNCPRYYGVGELVLEVEGGTCKALNIKKGYRVDFA